MVLTGAALALALWLIGSDPREALPMAPSPATVAIYDRNGSLLYEALDPEQGKGGFVPLGQLPRHLVAATVATEDASFYSNPGIDPLAILRALGQNLRGEAIVSGGSTITQQLARNLWMSPRERSELTLGRKLREMSLALRLSASLSKDEILELYLNSISYGHQARGVEAAARIYFGKGARDLDLVESALLAGLPQAPSAYDPFENPDRAKTRRQVVLSLMVKQGYVGEAEARAAGADPLRLAPAAFPVRAPHFVAYVRRWLSERPDLDPAAAGPLRVHTTLDLGLQETAEAVVRRHVAALADRNVTNGALVALDPSAGHLLAMVGSADYFDPAIDGEVNVALAPRQPGSSLKPILYAAALEGGLTAATVLYDVPTSFLTADGKSYSPEDYDQTWRGPVSVREALANSLNVPAVSVLQRTGIGVFLGMATRAGLSSLAASEAGDLSLALGSGEVRLLDLVWAFAAFAAGGEGREPRAVSRVEDSWGRVVWEPKPSLPRRVTSPQVAYLVSSILSDEDARAASFGRAGPLKLSRPAAAKTGTTTDWRDNWTVGFTPDLAAGVWVGNSDNSPMRGVSGISGAAPIWHDFMEEALKGRPALPFQEPPGLVRREVCPESGELPSPSCPNRRTELFVAGTEPSATCSWHVPVLVDPSTGLPAGPETPHDRVEQRVYLAVPPELQRWARERGIPQPPAGYQPSALSRQPPIPGPQPQDPTGNVPAPPPASTSEVPGARLLLVSPARGAVLQISADLPAALQRVEVAAAAAGLPPGTRVELRVDGALLTAFDAPPYGATWQVTPGRHLFRAVALDPSGSVLASGEAEITVEDTPHGP